MTDRIFVSAIGQKNSNGKLNELTLYLCISRVVSLEYTLSRCLAIVSVECLDPFVVESVGLIFFFVSVYD